MHVLWDAPTFLHAPLSQRYRDIPFEPTEPISVL